MRASQHRRSVARFSARRWIMGLLAVEVLAMGSWGCAREAGRGPQGPLNLVWLVIDAQRADHLGCYGYPRDTSPVLDAFAAEGVRFSNAISQESYTQASVPSYLTSTYPLQHRVLYGGTTIDVLGPRFVTIAEVLGAKGYATAAFVFNPHLKAAFGFDQGFDLYDDNKEGWPTEGPRDEAMETARKMHHKVERYLGRVSHRPVFLYLHYRDVHSPYAPPPPYNALFLPPQVQPLRRLLYPERVSRFSPAKLAVMLSQYDGEIRYTDAHIGATLEFLESCGITRENSIIIITADHGEEFGDPHPGDPGGWEHGRTLYAEQIRVPLVLSLPGVRVQQRVVESYVELVDIVPTVLDVLGVDWRMFGQFKGKSLVPLIAGEEPARRLAYSGGNHGRAALMLGDWKYYRYDRRLKGNRRKSFHRASGDYAYEFGEELYHLREDPRETRNLISEAAETAARLRSELERIEADMAPVAGGGAVEMDEATRKQLEALGYF
jgi:arylsulfatase A-like enzyme